MLVGLAAAVLILLRFGAWSFFCVCGVGLRAIASLVGAFGPSQIVACGPSLSFCYQYEPRDRPRQLRYGEKRREKNAGSGASLLSRVPGPDGMRKPCEFLAWYRKFILREIIHASD